MWLRELPRAPGGYLAPDSAAMTASAFSTAAAAKLELMRRLRMLAAP